MTVEHTANNQLDLVVERWSGVDAVIESTNWKLAELKEARDRLVGRAKENVREGLSTGDRFLDMAIGVHGSLDPKVAECYRQIESEIAGCAGQLVLIAERAINDDCRTCGLDDLEGDGVVGLTGPDRPRPHRRLLVGCLSGKELLFDREKLTVHFPTSNQMVSCTTDWECLIFVYHGEPKLEPTNLPLNIYTEDALARVEGKPMPSGMCVLIGDEAIKQWFKENAPLANNFEGEGWHSGPCVWDMILATFNPASAASDSSQL